MARTSVSHPLQVDDFPLGGGRLGMTLCPGRKGPSGSGPDWHRDLAADIQALQEWGATMVVSLTETAEMKSLAVETLGEAVQEAGMTWLHLPIADLGTPDASWSARWPEVSPIINQELASGGKVVIHCRAGLERTAMVAALIQCEHGAHLDTALRVIAETRQNARPLWQQRAWVEAWIASANRSR